MIESHLEVLYTELEIAFGSTSEFKMKQHLTSLMKFDVWLPVFKQHKICAMFHLERKGVGKWKKEGKKKEGKHIKLVRVHRHFQNWWNKSPVPVSGNMEALTCQKILVTVGVFIRAH